jgi:phosphoglycerate-specific signal transduction histidine kinase
MFQLSSIVVGFFFAIFCVSTWKLFLVARSQIPSIEEKIQDNETRLNGLYDLLTRDYEEVNREIDTKIENTKREIDGIYNTLIQDDCEILRQMNEKINALQEELDNLYVTDNNQNLEEIDYLYSRVDDLNSEINSLHDRLDALDQDELSGNPEQV